MKELGEALGLDEPPSIMECFDISNVSSNHIVASMVRFTNGKPDNKAYRRYRIRTVDGQNDFASMSEVIRRRYSRILMESDAVASRPPDMTLYQWLKKLSAEGKAPIKVPDLVVVDGGKGQLSSAWRTWSHRAWETMPSWASPNKGRKSSSRTSRNRSACPTAREPSSSCSAYGTKPTASPTDTTNCYTGNA